MVTTSLRTDRLELRPVRDEDVDRILEFRNLPEVTRWLIRTEVEPTSFRAACRRAADDPDDHSMAVVRDGVVIGTVSLEVVDGMGQPGMPTGSEAGLGYIFDPAYAGHGYATEAVTAVVAHAFAKLGIRRITAGCYADNLASARILEKVGMRREQHGVGDSWHAELGWIDGYTYGLLADDWRDRPSHRSGTLTEPPRNGSEIDTLVGSLERGRRYLAWKCGGLDAAGLRATLGPSSVTLGGLLKHLAYMEDANFSFALHGNERAEPWRGVERAGEWAFASAAHDSPEELFALWERSVAAARANIDRAVRLGGAGFTATYAGQTFSLRRILADMVEEYLRHVGHADLIRESIDGLVGEDPDD